MDRKGYILDLVKALPENPGVYQFFDEKQQIIYIGKAKNLKKRVSSYFQKSHDDNGKVRVMVAKIYDLHYILVNSESDALLLENNLIKKYKPRYNILLKDDKTYPWICIKNELFPRIFQTRNVIKDGSFYFGPYTSVTVVRTILDLIRELFSIRNCSLPLTEQNIASSRFKVCLEFHLGNCKGPCVGLQMRSEYDDSVDQIRAILKGNLHQVKDYLEALMTRMANEFKFEEAELVKQKLAILARFQSKSTIVNPSINNIDVFSFIDEKKLAVVNFLKVMNGSIIQTHTVEIVKRLNEEREELLALAILDIRERFDSRAAEVIVPFSVDIGLSSVKINVPKIGDKKSLLELSERNAKYYLIERHKNLERANPEFKFERLLETLKSDLRLSEVPDHIECFDNSNIQGTNPVSSCVVFKGGKPAKSEYRHFNIKTVVGPNDFASMEEVVMRRYKRKIEENSPLPKLVIIDGGKGQLNIAVQCFIKLGIFGNVALIGIAKRLEEIYFPGDSVPVYLDKKSSSLKLIQQIRDEAHRFGIQFHRDQRSKAMTRTGFDDIPGVGKKTMELLYNKYGSISTIKNTPYDDLVALIGAKKATLVLKSF